MRFKNIVLAILLTSSWVNLSYADDAPARQALMVQAQSGDVNAQYELAKAYYFAEGLEWNYDEALTWFKRAAAQGNADAMYQVGYMYDLGEGIEEDNLTAMKWYAQAAEKGQLRAQYSLGYLYLSDEDGVVTNLKKGVEWIARAADAGFDVAQTTLGRMYEAGLKGLPQDLGKARHYLQLAAQQGDATAMNALAFFYIEGTGGVEKDNKEALRLFSLASEASGLASFSAGLMHEYGEGTIKNYKKAAEFYERALEQDNEDGWQGLARLYKTGGFGLAKNLKKSQEYERLWREAQSENNASE